MIIIKQPGLTRAGVPLDPQSVLELGPSSEAAYVATGKASYYGEPGSPITATGIAQALEQSSQSDLAKIKSSVSGGSGGGYNGPQLLVVTVGNSINNGINQGTSRNNNSGVDPLGWWASGSDVHVANMLAGSPLKFGRVTATAQTDKWGNYTHSGWRLDQILGEIVAQLYTPLDNAGIKPDLIIGHSLLENDIAQAATYAQCVSRLNTWLLGVQGRYPSARILLCTPRPSYSYNTPAVVSVYQQITSYIMSLDNGSTLFAAKMNGYEDPATPGIPLAGYTDVSVHPNVAGGWVNARVSMLPAIKRIVSAAFPAYRSTSQNFALTGSTAATGTNISGTTATGTSHAGTANGTVALVANDPSVTITYTQTAGASFDMSTLQSGQHPVSGFTLYSPYIKIRIDSGADDVRLIALQPRGSDGTTLPFFNVFAGSTSDNDPISGQGYKNGEVLTIRAPAIGQSDFGTAGPLTSIYNYIRVYRKSGTTGLVQTGGSISITALDSGVGLVA